jgi:branched-chain amino acid aminotransferase
MPAEQATISIDDRGFLAADGVFETALLHDGGFFRLGQHLERFAASADGLRIAAPAAADLDAIIRRVARENGMRSAAIRITLTRGVRNPTLLVTARRRTPPRPADARRGWRLITAATRRPSTASVPAQLKALGRTYAILARHEAAAAGADDALLLTDDGYAARGPPGTSSGAAATPSARPRSNAGVLAGVTRSVISDLAPAAGLCRPRRPLPPPRPGPRRRDLRYHDVRRHRAGPAARRQEPPQRHTRRRRTPAPVLAHGSARRRRRSGVRGMVHASLSPVTRLPPMGTTVESELSRISEEQFRANRFALVSRLADDLAHEIKNPLNAIVINLEVLRTRVARADADGALTRGRDR